MVVEKIVNNIFCQNQLRNDRSEPHNFTLPHDNVRWCWKKIIKNISLFLLFRTACTAFFITILRRKTLANSQSKRAFSLWFPSDMVLRFILTQGSLAWNHPPRTSTSARTWISNSISCSLSTGFKTRNNNNKKIYTLIRIVRRGKRDVKVLNSKEKLKQIIKNWENLLK
jgi:hypothetical protein